MFYCACRFDPDSLHVTDNDTNTEAPYEHIFREFRASMEALVRNDTPLTDQEFWDATGDIHLRFLSQKSQIKRALERALRDTQVP